MKSSFKKRSFTNPTEQGYTDFRDSRRESRKKTNRTGGLTMQKQDLVEMEGIYEMGVKNNLVSN